MQGKVSFLNINDRKVRLIVQRKNVRNVYLRLKPDFQLEITIPEGKDVSVQQLLKKKRHWIEEKIQKVAESKRIFQNDKIMHKGQYLKIKVFPVKNPLKGIRMYRKFVHVYEAQDRKKDEILKSFLTEQTRAYVSKMAKHFSEKLGASFSKIHTKDMKKWGFCTKDRDLFFNWRLICLPEPLAEYVILHEVLHLKNFNHSSQFKKQMARLCIDYRSREELLKSYLIR